MSESHFILLKRNPNGSWNLMGASVQPYTLAEARRTADRHIMNAIAVGGEPDEMLLFDLSSNHGRGLSIGVGTIGALERSQDLAKAFEELGQ